MRFINKSRDTPPELITDRIRYNEELVDSNYVRTKSFDTGLRSNQKDLIRKKLVAEQFGLCAYCQGPISGTDKTTSIEHLICQSHSSHYSLAYHNLLAVCNNSNKHCDKARASNNSYLTPIWFFDDCQTTGWDQLNPYFDVEINLTTQRTTGIIVPALGRQNAIKVAKVQELITELDLNNQGLVKSRFIRLDQVNKKILNGTATPRQLFDNLLNEQNQLRLPNASLTATPYPEFLLLALRKL